MSLFNSDISTTLSYFQQLQAENPMFFYAVQIDSNNCAKNMFWVDGRSRMAYQHFGDAVTFDTTYCTNKYSMPFAPFIGVNHHSQTILLGCALIRDETVESFMWVFRTWLNAMFGKHPTCILTDQDPSMRKAISEVLPNTAHRFCKWHILRKAHEHIGILFGTKEKFQEDFLSCINFSLTVEDFESSWTSMIEKHRLEDNTHLKHLYQIRDKWVPSYFRNIFCAFMSTTQRSESFNALLKGRVNNHTTIYEFVMQYEKALEDRYDIEEEEDFRSLQYKPSSWSPSPIERHAQKIYTRAMFRVFKDQLKEIFSFSLNEMEPKALYKLVQVPNSEKPSARRRTYMVTFQAPATVSCNCKMFEFSGMVCSHVLKVLLHLDIFEIPSEYILKRWTKSAKEESFDTHQCLSIESSNSSSKTLMFNSLSRKIMKLVAEGSTSIELYNLANKKIDQVMGELVAAKMHLQENKSMHDDMTQIQGSACSQAQESIIDNNCMVRAPPISNCKGKRKMQRFKPHSELKAKKQRTCGKCHGKGHNSRTCKEKLLFILKCGTMFLCKV
ncbi:protein FAR1-RELATED SEQUENCE 5-like [Asparagus officinalis]|uniref:protein FAR1-RELATED SEQUENCE 5-like n=1 Tax=Asparagus officinalis TaxID=4686 RepID=UPI00098E48C3|nr:protein FAR1-RELATED SEQUENCE 5-like [Asparagus officinalis]